MSATAPAEQGAAGAVPHVRRAGLPSAPRRAGRLGLSVALVAVLAGCVAVVQASPGDLVFQFKATWSGVGIGGVHMHWAVNNCLRHREEQGEFEAYGVDEAEIGGDSNENTMTAVIGEPTPGQRLCAEMSATARDKAKAAEHGVVTCEFIVRLGGVTGRIVHEAKVTTGTTDCARSVSGLIMPGPQRNGD